MIAVSYTVLCSSLLAAYVVVNCIYNLYFHPLAHVPGPFWCKVSGWPSFLASRTGFRHIWIWQNQQIYGDRFRYKPNGVLIATPQAYHDIYNSKANIQKARFYEVWSNNKHDRNALNSIDKAQHLAKRKPLNKGFSDKSLISVAPFVEKHVDRWIYLLADGKTTADTSEWSTPKNLGGQWADFLTFDVLGDLLFGKDLDLKEPGNPLRAIPGYISKYLLFMYSVAHSPFLAHWLWLKSRGLDVVMQALTPKPAKDFFDWVEKQVHLRMEAQTQIENGEKSAREDLFHYLSISRDAQNNKFNYHELLSSARLLMLAGSDTTSTAICSIFFHLTRNPRVYNKLAKEIRETFSSAEEIRYGLTISNCQYLHACIWEGLRMTPAGPSDLPREVMAGGHTIDGVFYPQGTLVGAPSYPVHYHEETFGDPFTFRPERWIPNEEEGYTAEDVSRLKDSFRPFSMGPGVCSGKNLAMYEMQLVFARMIYSFDVRRPPEDKTNLGGGNPKLGWMRHDKNHYQISDGFISIRVEGPSIQLKAI